jgi:hypothetical protein
MRRKNAIKIPAESIVDLMATGTTTAKETGDMIIFLDKIAYMRKLTTGDGLFRMVTGVDITVKPDMYEVVSSAVA